MSIVLSSILILFVNPLFAETSGEDLYLRGSYMDAESYFREKDMNNPKDVRWRYNRGCATFKSDQLDASLSAFNSVTKRTDDPEILFRASYNAGNVLFKKGDFASAAQFYIQALKIKPDDEDARFNLSLALAKKKAADQQDQQKQCDNPKQGDQNQQSQNNQQNNDQQQKQDQKDQQSKKQDQEKKSDEKKDGKEKSDEKKQQQQNAEKKKEEQKPDMSQELKAAQAMPSEENKENEPTPEEKAQKMAQMKAEALLDNIQEDQSIMIKRMQSEKEGDARSGKHW
jgi:Ca-activated chloride channel family protein